jgi:hypothetical protein
MSTFIWSAMASLQEMTGLFPSKGLVRQFLKSLYRWNRWFYNMMDDVVGSFAPGMRRGTQLDDISAGDAIRVHACERYMLVRDVCLWDVCLWDASL